MANFLGSRTGALVRMPACPWDVLLLLTSLLLSWETVHGCDEGWFGKSCKFRCHCRPGVVCLSDGQCPAGQPCDLGYFGPACQYEDLLYQRASPDTPVYLRDGSDSTCYTDSHITSVSVGLNASLPVSWLRIRNYKFAYLFSFTVKINNATWCSQEKRFINNRHEVDVVCTQPVLLTQLVIEGEIAPTLCSIYISGGRNLALRQPANQTSTFSSTTGASNAVDGDPRAETSGSKCVQTKMDHPPRWSLYFQTPQMLTRVTLINSAYKDTMRWFSLYAYSTNQSKVLLHTETNTAVQEYFDIILLSKVPVSRLEIVGAVRNPRSLQRLQFCELEAFGDPQCPEGRFGLECQEHCTCNKTVPCHPVTGLCAHICPRDRFGVSCSHKCSTSCYPGMCSPYSGVCSRCKPGLDGHHCDVVCDRGTYGLGCASVCPANCANDCNAATGDCLYCTESFYGNNCNQSCPEGCSDGPCHIDTGHCLQCSQGFVGPRCEATEVKVTSSRSFLWLILPSLLCLVLFVTCVYVCGGERRYRRHHAEDESLATTIYM